MLLILTVLNQQHLEILAMLDVKQHTMAQETMSLSKSGFTEITGLEVSTLKGSYLFLLMIPLINSQRASVSL